MFAVVAMICFILDLFHAHLGGWHAWVTLGLVFIAAHLAFSGSWSWTPWRGPRNP
jgi:hypothetical protein